MKTTWKMTILFVMVLLVLSLSGCAPSEPVENPQHVSQTSTPVPVPPEETESAVRPSFIQSDELILYLAKSDFIVGEDSRMGFTVLFGENLSGDILLMDDTGKTVSVLSNDGNGRIDGEIPVYETEARTGSLRAVCADTVSREVKFYVHPPISDIMMDRLYEVADGLGDFVLSLNADDPGSEEVLRKVSAYLQDDPQVDQVTEIDGTVFYTTTDGLLGSYNMGVPEPGYLGTVSADEAYESVLYQDDKQLQDVSLPSDRVLTNGNIMIITPQWDGTADAGTMMVHTYTAYEMMEAFENTINQQFASQNKSTVEVPSYGQDNGDEARKVLLSGDFTDCGVLILLMHGNIKKGIQGDNDALLYMTLGESDSSQGLYQQYADQFWIESQNGSFGNNIQNNTRAIYDITIDPKTGRLEHTIRLTRNFFENVLSDKTFDNTVVYLFICYGFSDNRFTDLFLDHGACMVIGCEDSLEISYSLMLLSEITQSMAYADDSGIYGTARAGKNKLSEQSLHTFEHFLASDNDSYESFQASIVKTKLQAEGMDLPSSIAQYNHMTETERLNATEEWLLNTYREAVKNGHTISIRYRNEAAGSQFVIAGSGDVEGRVVNRYTNEIKTPMIGAEVKFYRWFNHVFEEDKRFSARTDENGCYSVKGLPYGIWAIETEYASKKAFVILEHYTDLVNAKDIELSFWLDGHVTTQLDMKDNEPLQGVSITLYDKDGQIIQPIQETDYLGDYRFTVGLGEYKIVAEKDGMTASRTVTVDEDTIQMNDAREAIVQAKDIVLGWTVSGYVTDELTGQPLEGVKVSFGDGSKLSSPTTDEKGFWYVNLPQESSLSIYFSKEGYKDSTAYTGVVSGSHQFTQEMSPLYCLSGIVQDEITGKVLNGVTVSCFNDGISYTTESDDSGRFIFQTIQPGDYTISFRKSNYQEKDESFSQYEGSYIVMPDPVKLMPLIWEKPQYGAVPQEAMHQTNTQAICFDGKIYARGKDDIYCVNVDGTGFKRLMEIPHSGTHIIRAMNYDNHGGLLFYHAIYDTNGAVGKSIQRLDPDNETVETLVQLALDENVDTMLVINDSLYYSVYKTDLSSADYFKDNTYSIRRMDLETGISYELKTGRNLRNCYFLSQYQGRVYILVIERNYRELWRFNDLATNEAEADFIRLLDSPYLEYYGYITLSEHGFCLPLLSDLQSSYSSLKYVRFDYNTIVYDELRGEITWEPEIIYDEIDFGYDYTTEYLPFVSQTYLVNDHFIELDPFSVYQSEDMRYLDAQCIYRFSDSVGTYVMNNGILYVLRFNDSSESSVTIESVDLTGTIQPSEPD